MLTREEKEQYGIFEDSRGYETYRVYTARRIDPQLEVSENSDGRIELRIGDEKVTLGTLELLGFIFRLLSWVKRKTFITEEEEQEVKERNADLRIQMLKM
jgi:hypothetical protein